MTEKDKDAKAKDEIEVLISISKALEPLSKEARERILRYARDKFGVYMGDS